MKSSYKVALGVAGLAVIGGVLTPQFGFGQEANAMAHDSGLDRIVTKRFDNVNVNEVFAWLVGQGFSYVIKDTDFTDTRVSMNIDHQTVWDAANSLADVLGGHWIREGRVYVFEKEGTFVRSGGNVPWASVNSERAADLADNANGQVPLWTKSLDDSSKNQSNQSTPYMMVIPDEGQLTPEQKKTMGDWGKQFGDSMKNFRFDMPKAQWTPEQQKAFEHQMENWSKQFGESMKNFKLDAPNFQMTPDQQKSIEDWGKNFGENMKNFKFDVPDGQWTPEQQKKFEDQMGNWGKQFGDSMKNFKLDAPNFQMTPDQQKSIEDWGKNFGENMKNFKFDVPDGQWTPEQKKQFEGQMNQLHEQLKSLKSMPPVRIDPKQQKELQMQLKGLGEQMKDFKFVFPNNEMSREQQKQFEMQMQEWSKRFQDKFKDGKLFDSKGFNQKEWEEFGKRMQKWSEEFTKSMGKDGNVKALPPLPPLPPMAPAPKSEIADPGDVD